MAGSHRSRLASWLACPLAVTLAGVLRARAALADGAGADVPSVFFIAKSENKNQVNYGIHVDADCAPAGAAPVFAYWRMLEKGPQVTEPLLAHEIPAYGFASQRVSSGPYGGSVVVALRSLPSRPIVVTTRRERGACMASAEAVIAGVPARLTRVFVQLGWFFGVKSLTLDGYAKADGHAVREQIAK